MKISRVALQLVFAGMMLPAFPGCITRPTVDLTKAPFRASTELSEAPLRASSELTNGTTNATAELVRPTKEFTSSTSPNSWFTGEGTLKAEHKVMAFAAFNFDSLKQDMARGHGEYLASFATIVGVPAEHQPEFFRTAQGTYPIVYAEGIEPGESLRRLIHEFTANPVRGPATGFSPAVPLTASVTR
jgi:Protein of unknown function (DUF3015)